MTPADREAFLKVVIGFAELKGKALSAPALELYWQAMQHWPITEFRLAAQQLLRTCEFMPTPKDFEDLRRDGMPTVAEAWDAVLQHCKGAYRSGAGIDNDGPIDTAVRGLGGYRAIAFHDTEKLHFLQRQFSERFDELVDVMETREVLPQLVDQNTRTAIRHEGPRALRDVMPKLQKPKREDAA